MSAQQVASAEKLLIDPALTTVHFLKLNRHELHETNELENFLKAVQTEFTNRFDGQAGVSRISLKYHRFDVPTPLWASGPFAHEGLHHKCDIESLGDCVGIRLTSYRAGFQTTEAHRSIQNPVLTSLDTEARYLGSLHLWSGEAESHDLDRVADEVGATVTPGCRLYRVRSGFWSYDLSKPRTFTSCFVYPQHDRTVDHFFLLGLPEIALYTLKVQNAEENLRVSSPKISDERQKLEKSLGASAVVPVSRLPLIKIKSVEDDLAMQETRLAGIIGAATVNLETLRVNSENAHAVVSEGAFGQARDEILDALVGRSRRYCESQLKADLAYAKTTTDKAMVLRASLSARSEYLETREAMSLRQVMVWLTTVQAAAFIASIFKSWDEADTSTRFWIIVPIVLVLGSLLNWLIGRKG